ncbi:MAG: YceD family protein [Alcaligenaceae bacterium]|nr:YceD family protein [Alcaligenaceae bacterium]
MNQDLQIDTYSFVSKAQTLEEQTFIGMFSRLLEDLPEQASDTMVSWSLSSSVDGVRKFLHMHVQAKPHLVCQRCLKPFEYSIDSSSSIEMVDSEDLLDIVFNEDDLSEDMDCTVERMVHHRRFDVMQLVEDELILSIPYVPRHEACIDFEVEEEVKESPFSVLKKLKH